VCVQDIAADFDLCHVLSELHSYLSSGPCNTCVAKDNALVYLAYLLGDASASGDGNGLFDGLNIRAMEVYGSVDIPDTPFSLASARLVVQVKGAASNFMKSTHNCALVMYNGIAAFLVPADNGSKTSFNSFMQPKSPFCCLDSEQIEDGMVCAPWVGRALAELVAAFGGVSHDD